MLLSNTCYFRPSFPRRTSITKIFQMVESNTQKRTMKDDEGQVVEDDEGQVVEDDEGQVVEDK